MAEKVFTDAFLEINSVDLSDQANEVRLDTGREMKDKSRFGKITRLNKAGAKTWSISVTFLQNYDAGKVDATLWPLYDNGTEFTVKVRPRKTDAIGPTNPEYSAVGVISNYQPVGGAWGDLQNAPLSIEAADDLSRATA